MTPQQFSSFVGPHPQLPEDAAQHARCMERIARTKAAGAWRHLPKNNRETYNRETRRFEWAPVDADGIARDLEFREQLRASERALYQLVNGKPRTPKEPGTIQCGDCGGDGVVSYPAGFSAGLGFCQCATCLGTGWRK